MKKTILNLLLLLALISPVQALEVDKEKHLAAGIALGTFGWEVGCGAGVAKEGYDKVYGGSVEALDFAYTCLGAGLTALLGRDRGLLYRAATSAILLDGVSTSGFMRNPNAIEITPLWVNLFGSRPTDRDILIMTAVNLAALEATERWMPPIPREITQMYLIWSRYKIVKINFELARW